MWKYLVLSLLAILLLHQLNVAVPNRGPIPDTPQGFDAQYKWLLATYYKGDDKMLESLLDDFKIPSPWFEETFGPEEGPKLEKLYDEQQEQFKKLTVQKLHFYERLLEINRYSINYHMRTVLLKDPSNDFPAAPPPALLKPVPQVLRFTISYQLGAQDPYALIPPSFPHARVWMECFMYLDGKFRFVGEDGVPFWADPAKAPHPNLNGFNPSRLSALCVKDIKQATIMYPDDQIVYRVEPIYPDAMLKKHLEGETEVVLMVGIDGSIKKVDVLGLFETSPYRLEGGSSITKPVKKAVMQWRYKPFTNCGKPVEVQVGETLHFPPN